MNVILQLNRIDSPDQNEFGVKKDPTLHKVFHSAVVRLILYTFPTEVSFKA